MKKPLTLREIAEAVAGELLFADEKDGSTIFIKNVSTDSRKVAEGDLFVPVKGESFDGHAYIEQSFEKGAVCCFSSNDVVPKKGKYVIKVKDTRQALRDLAEYYMTFFHPLVVAITGSVGKTTTKDMVASVLTQKYKVLKNEGNYNNDIGLPLTAFRLTQEHEVAVLEMGMNSFGEIHNLSKIAKPEIAVITNVGVSHIEMLGDRDGILRAKSEVFDFMTDEGIAILNGDNDKLVTLDGSIPQRIIWYGVENKKNIYAYNIIAKGLECTSCTIHTELGEMDVTIPVPGAHMVLNALSATAVGITLHLTLEQIKKGIEEFTPTKMRMAVTHTEGGITIINDVYNANPVSMKAAIDVLSVAEGRKVCILGDMGELGTFAEKMHEEVGRYAVEKGMDVIITIGKLSKSMDKAAKEAGGKNIYHYNNQEAFIAEGLNMLSKGDTVLVKGSRSMGLEKTVEKIQGVK